jgi:uridine phosphorylase
LPLTPIRLPADASLPLLRAKVADVASSTLVVGDPGRAERAAGLLEGAREVGRNREYATFTGAWHGTPVTVASHGVGAAGAAVCFEELCRAGARKLVRAGTCGGMQPDIRDGSLVVLTAAVRDEGLTRGLVPETFPAVADLDLTHALRGHARTSGLPVVAGIGLTADVFYPHQVLPGTLELWQRAGVVAVEMEAAALFVTAALHGVAAGAVLAVDGNPLAEGDEDMSGYDPFRPEVDTAVAATLQAALATLA